MEEAGIRPRLETAVFVLRDDRRGIPQKPGRDTLKKMLEYGTAGGLPANAQDNYKIIKIQFNPTSLNFHMGDAQKTESRGDIGYREDGEKRYADHDTVDRKGLSLSMELLFDKSTGKKPGVLTDVNEFMYIIKNPYVRRVDFYWGRMQYSGIIESIGSEFTYFMPDGTPARAKVNFSMDIQNDELINIIGAGADGFRHG